MPPTLSKSKYISGLQCPKLLWTHYNAPDAIPPPDAAKQAIFDTGHAVGDLAKRLYPDGVEVPWSRDLGATTAATRPLLERRVPIFEASFEVDGCYCRADILVPVDGGAWDLYEVKSGTSVKNVNVEDVAFQADVLERAGIRLDRLFLMHINRDYVRRGAVDPHGLFRAEDITDRARALQPGVAGRAAQMHRTIAGDRPDIPIGVRCFAPYDCELWRECAGFLPEFSVLELTGIRKERAFRMIADRIAAIADVPADDLSAKHRIQQAAILAGTPHVARTALRKWLHGLQYPLYCLDFETMNPAVPLVEGTRPYQQVPFQLSIHVLEAPGSPPTHIEYLAESPGDPRPGVIEALGTIGPAGTILAYNMRFERGIIRALAEAFPDSAGFLRGLDRRFMDLMEPFGSFWYYDRDQRGSCSLKAVLPVLTGSTYEGMEIADGGQAQRDFQWAVFGGAEAGEKSRTLGALREYCRQDTRGMVDLLDALGRVVAVG